ncbi:MAG TPA: type II CAAX endopeptidase family protein [Bryobacteraceae bacterium]|nr:type II CAAX endopeptidase family protein [Bryobacteraceae bacterium]
MSKFFAGPFGLRSGWRALLFVVLAFVLGGICQGLLHLPPLRRPGRKFAELSEGGGVLLAILGAMWIMAPIDGKPLFRYGLGRAHWGRNLLAGVAAGFGALSLLMVLLIGAGAFRPGGIVLHGAELAYWSVESAIAFVFAACNEELLTRGYTLFALAQGVGFWPAAAMLSLLFGAGHAGNGGEDFIGVANAVLAGMVFAYSLWWSGSLWWAIGCHLSWDWGESFFYGVADSGGVASHHFLSGAPAGPAWLSGGTVEPEGSVLAALVLAALAAAARFTTPRYRAEGLERLKVLSAPPGNAECRPLT